MIGDFVMDIKEMFKHHLNKNSVFKNKEIISPHYIPDELPFRETQIKEVITILAPVITGNRSNNLFIYGKTGTGKTSTIKKVIDKMNEIIKEQNIDANKVVTYYVNCRNHNSKYKIMLKIVAEICSENYVGYSASFVYDKVIEQIKKDSKLLILILDEVDLIKDVDEAIYSFTRANDEIGKGGISVIGISNNIMFKEKLDPRTRSSLCEKELLFPPYNARELSEILKQRISQGFHEGVVDDSAISLAAAYSAQESGDARTALMLIERAGELADIKELQKVTENDVRDAKSKVEEEIIISMISTLPEQVQLVLYAIADLTRNKRFSVTLLDRGEVLYSGDIYTEYTKITKELGKTPVSTKWFKQYLDELELYGLIATTLSGKGVRGSTTLVKLGFDARTICTLLKTQLSLDHT